VLLRLGICLTLAIALGSGLGEGQAHASPATSLGKAYRSFESGDFAGALRLGKKVPEAKLKNPDYLQYLLAQSQYFEGRHADALTTFGRLSKMPGSRFRDLARWRSADCLWQLGRKGEAASSYRGLLKSKVPGGEWAIARFRVAAAAEANGDKNAAVQGYKDFLRSHPGHDLTQAADNRLVALGDGGIAALSPSERIQRATDLITAKKWEIALAELAELDTKGMDAKTRLSHRFWLSMSLFKRRRHYEKAGKTFLEIYKKMGPRADEALFHGARAMSRADFDKVAIQRYQSLVKEYPRSKWAAEAQFLSGWLEFNMGNYRDALPYMKVMSRRYGKSKFTPEAPWYRAMSHFQLGEYKAALPLFEKVGRQSGKEKGGKGRYWTARSLHKLGKKTQANVIYRSLISDYPFSWYALLSRSRLKAQKIEVGPFGNSKRKISDVPDLDTRIDKKLLRDELIIKANELIAAGLMTEAGYELRRGEKRFFKRHAKNKSAAMAMLLDRYRKAGNFNRPWMLAVVHGGSRALNVEPKGTARLWWQHAYPKAYEKLVEKYRKLSGFPDYYLYTIMRKESGFNPHTHSYADAQGLLQMIPPTTERVVPHLGIEYTEDLLFDPELNIQAGAWYIGRLLKKFRNQVPIGAGSYNGGPRAVMRWLRKNPDHPIDEFVELVSYRQTRNYMKRTTETYARYKYLYDGDIYEQPLTLNADFLVNDIDY
jgi:soluble lytic murein transglycosylase